MNSNARGDTVLDISSLIDVGIVHLTRCKIAGEFDGLAFVDPQLGEEMQRRVMKGVQISREGEYVLGKLDGAVYHYNQKGRLTQTEHFNLGILEHTDIH